MKKYLIATLLFAPVAAAHAQGVPAPSVQNDTAAHAQSVKKASAWVGSLSLNDVAKADRLTQVIASHLDAVRDWNNTHPANSVPEGIDPATGKKLSGMDRQIIACSAMPRTVHQALMDGLRKDLDSTQVDAILDKYTMGKVAFTEKGYRAIVPDLTSTEDSVILANLDQAREQAVDFKNSKEISAIFEIYKTKNEQYLNTHGRDWHALYKVYAQAQKNKK